MYSVLTKSLNWHELTLAMTAWAGVGKQEWIGGDEVVNGWFSRELM